MLADYVRATVGDRLFQESVLELDNSSPLQTLFRSAKSYTRTFFSADVPIGTVAEDGSQMQDITKLGFPDQHFDLIVSSEVLEHVPDLGAAFAEMRRVLKPGGRHIFTVPPAQETKQLATVIEGQIKQIVHPPEYHGDPLGDGKGILAFWHLGPDFPEKVDTAGLSVKVVMGPEGNDRRIVWCAERI
jgi:SAM-dependent methyltransferase